MFNRAILIGRLTADPELKQTQSGISVCSFSIAVDRRFSGRDSERKTDFINITSWRQQANSSAATSTRATSSGWRVLSRPATTRTKTATSAPPPRS